MTKIKTVTLTDGHAPNGGWAPGKTDKDRRFRVETITDSIEYSTGQFLERSEVEQLCASKDWKVTIRSIR